MIMNFMKILDHVHVSGIRIKTWAIDSYFRDQRLVEPFSLSTAFTLKVSYKLFLSEISICFYELKLPEIEK